VQSSTAEDAAELVLADELLAGVGAFRRGLRHTGPDWPFGPLTGAQAELLRLVRREPGISVAAAAAGLRLAANTVSTLVSQLSQAGLLVRTPDPADRRVARLELTDATRDQLGRWRDGRVHALADALGDLPAEKRRLLADAVPVLAALTRTLDDHAGFTTEQQEVDVRGR
jgi:DNA-binding MarR family transcriptional regulator